MTTQATSEAEEYISECRRISSDTDELIRVFCGDPIDAEEEVVVSVMAGEGIPVWVDGAHRCVLPTACFTMRAIDEETTRADLEVLRQNDLGDYKDRVARMLQTDYELCVASIYSALVADAQWYRGVFSPPPLRDRSFGRDHNHYLADGTMDDVAMLVESAVTHICEHGHSDLAVLIPWDQPDGKARGLRSDRWSKPGTTVAGIPAYYVSNGCMRSGLRRVAVVALDQPPLRWKNSGSDISNSLIMYIDGDGWPSELVRWIPQPRVVHFGAGCVFTVPANNSI